VCDLGLSLFANTSCEIITEKVPEPSIWSAGVIAGVVVAVVVVVAGLVTGVVLWVRSGGGGYKQLAPVIQFKDPK
jgi:cytochrome b subunit of formate dehydrogenase